MRSEAISQLIRHGIPVTESNISEILQNPLASVRAIESIMAKGYLDKESLNQIYDFISGNFCSIVEPLSKLELVYSEKLDEVETRASILSRKINDVYNEISSAQVLETKMSGYLRTINLDFSEKAIVNTNTNATISGGIVYGLPVSPKLANTDLINGRKYTRGNITVYIRGSNVNEPNLGSLFVVKEQTNPRVPTVDEEIINSEIPIKIVGKSKVSGPRQIDLFIDKKDNEIFNQIDICLNRAHMVQFNFSNDGKTFERIYTRPKYIKNTPTPIGLRNDRYIKITFYKESHDRVDNGEYIYEVNIKKLNILRTTLSEEILFETNEIDIPGNFSKVAIDTCDNYRSNKVSIDYEININDSEWNSIRPVDKVSDSNSVLVPSVISVNDYVDNKIIVLRDNEVQVDGSYLYTLEFPQTFLTSNQIRIFSNELDSENNEWEGDTIFHWCYGIVRDTAEFSVGNNEIQINGKWITGDIKLTKGVYKIKVRNENYINIVNLFSNEIVDENDGEYYIKSEEGDTALVFDPLWPNNHKVIIEKSFDFLFSKELFEKTDYTLYNNQDNINVSTAKEHEELLIVYRLHQSETSTVKIRAKMKSIDNTSIPYIEKILIRLV